MPPLRLLLGKVDFSNPFLVLKEGLTPSPYYSIASAKQVGAVTLNYGMFVNAVLRSIIVAFAMFMVVKGINT